MNFNEILNNAVLGEIEKPKPVPVGSYEALIIGTEFKESQKKKTKMLEVQFELVAPQDDVNEVDLEEYGDSVAGKKLKMPFFLTEDSIFRLQDFILEHVGLELKGSTLDEAIPQLVNHPVGLRVTHEISQDGETVYVKATKTFALS